MHASLWQGIKLVFGKEFTLGLRFKAAWSTMFMFALTTLACVSLALQGAPLEPELAAALLWIILFFAAMAGGDPGDPLAKDRMDTVNDVYQNYAKDWYKTH